MAAEIDSFGKVLPQQAVGAVVRAALPWNRTIAEVDGHVGNHAEPAQAHQANDVMMYGRANVAPLRRRVLAA